MSALSRREAKKQFISFTLVIEAQEMIVTYQPNWMTDVGHFEFRSPEEPARRIPVSETGYRRPLRFDGRCRRIRQSAGLRPGICACVAAPAAKSA
jgi:hypothetical protein